MWQKLVNIGALRRVPSGDGGDARWDTAVILGLAVGLCVAVPGSVLAEDARGQGVGERQYEAFTPQGVRVGSFILRPSLSVSEAYDSNVFASESRVVDDFVTEINPNLVVSSNWANHLLTLEVDVEQRLYGSQTSEDGLEWRVGGFGRIDVRTDTQITVGFLYGALIEQRGTPDEVGGTSQPTEFSEIGASVSLEQSFNRLSAEISADYTELDFDDTPLIGGGVDDNDDRDRSVLEVVVQVGYELVADTVVFLRGTYNTRDFVQEAPVVLADRDSDGYELVVGALFELGSLATGEVFVGYQEQSFEDPVFPVVSSVAYGASVDWYVMPLTTVRLRAGNTIEDTTSGGASSFERRSVRVGLDHEFLRNLVASLDVGYAQEVFSGSSREDQTYDVELGLDYMINRAFSVGMFYGYEERSSNFIEGSFSRNVAGVRVRSEL